MEKGDRYMRKLWTGLIKNEGGQSAVLLVLALSLLLGCAALAVDLGMDYNSKEKVQNAADLAALAAAKALPDQYDALLMGVNTASQNGINPANVTVTTPYDGDFTLVEVVCTKENDHLFARVFGSDSALLTGRAVARMDPPKWMGAALPLLNVENTAIGDDISLWEKNSPGNFGVLYRNKMTWVEGNGLTPGHYVIEYEDGVYVENGKIGALKSRIEQMCSSGQTVFIFSLTNEAVDGGEVDLGQGTLVQKQNLVLLQCTVSSYSFSSISVTVDAVYDIYGNYGEAELPEDYVFVPGGSSSFLVE